MKEEQKVDLFRDTPVRYLGYTNEVGEAFRSLAPKSVVWLSYIVATGYVFADTAHKGTNVYNADSSSGRIKRTILSTTDTLVWQTFASVVVPGLTINRICATVQYFQKNSKNMKFKNVWIPTVIGLISIPFIIHPIDHAVEHVMDVSFRKWTNYHPKTPLSDYKDL